MAGATFKTGSFNILPSIAIMIITIAGTGALPYGVRRLLTGEWPTLKDEFEVYQTWRKLVWDVGAPHANTRDYKYKVEEVEAKWRSYHAIAGKEEAKLQ